MVNRSIQYWLIANLAVILAGCDWQSSAVRGDYHTTLGQATNDPNARMFRELYPDCYSVLLGYKASSGRTTLMMHAIIHQRYELTMKCVFTNETNLQSIVRSSEPSFLLAEIASVTKSSGGRLVVQYSPTGQVRFGTNEFSHLVGSGGQLESIVTLPVRTEPVAGVADYWSSQAPSKAAYRF